MGLPSLIISGEQLSDIYFNFEHPARDDLFSRTEQDVSEADEAAANMADAMDFALILGFRGEDQEALAKALVADFLARI